jgi:hypothetical protein
LLIAAAGTWGQIVLGVAVLGAFVQLAVGGLVGLGRRLPASLALLVPMVALGVGIGGTLAGLDEGVRAVRAAGDPAWVPWFALDDRARAFAPMALGGLCAAALALPPAMGAAWAGVRSFRGRGGTSPGIPRPGGRRWRVARALVGAAGGFAASLGLFAAGTLGGLLGPFTVPGVAFAALGLLCALAGSSASPRRRDAAVIGLGALSVGGLGASVAAVAFAFLRVRDALGDYDDVFGRVGLVVEAVRVSWGAVPAVAPALALVLLSALPGALWRRWRDAGPREAVDAACLGLFLLVSAGGLAWAGMRYRVLTRMAGDHAAVVLLEAFATDVPRRAPVPPRVLVADADRPKWLLLRDRGGAETAWFAEKLDGVGPAVRSQDGLLLPPALPMLDVYLGLAGSEAGEVGVVGCGPVTEQQAAEIRLDPLLATGRCGAFPLRLRVVGELPDPRVLIVLKERQVDDGGEVVPLASIGGLDGRDVVLRAQADATAADLAAALGMLGGARNVYLGHGVDLDGESIPVGVDPDLRVRQAALAP